MVRCFVLLGSNDRVRAQVERAWTVADSLCLVPPAYALAPDRLFAYQEKIAKLFYAG